MTEDKRTTKERLDELLDLLRGEYITENEFRAARVSILREGGINIADQEQYEEDEETPRGWGCACFLGVLLLIAVSATGVFLAAPYWPAPYGGAYARDARNWVVSLYDEIAAFFPSNSQPATGTPHEAGELAEPEQEPVQPALSPDWPFESSLSDDRMPLDVDIPAHLDNAALPEIDSRIFSMPDSDVLDGNVFSDDPDVTILVVPSTLDDQAVTDAPFQRGVVSVRNARIRSTPDTATNDNVVGWASSGDRLLILDEQISGDGAKWYSVRYEDGTKQGWISGSLVTLE